MIIQNRYFILVIVVGIVFPLDQITKLFIDRHLELHQSIDIIENYLNITYIYNSGIAFGFLGGINNPIWKSIFIVVSLGAITLILTILKSLEEELTLFAVALSLILAGALGNIVDRIRLGAVIDFLDFHIYSYHWPAFNVADSSITVGGLMLLFYQINKMFKG